jgi:hypothetical protein
MKITREYLKRVIKESIEEALRDEEGFGDDEEVAPAAPKKKYAAIRIANDYDRGGNATGYENVRSDKWSKNKGAHHYANFSSLLRKHYKAGPEVVFKKLYGKLKQTFERIAASDAWAMHNLDVDMYVQGFIDNSRKHAASGSSVGGYKALHKILAADEAKLKMVIEKAKTSVLKLHPDAGKAPKRIGVVGSDPGRGMSTPIYGKLAKGLDEPDDDDTLGDDEEDYD